MLSIGIVGLPNVGKSTLFKALTKKEVEIANYPFATIDPNVGVVQVPDERLKKLAEVSKSAQIIPTAIEFVDIAGLVKGAAEGEGLGNQFLHNIREVNAILYLVRAFEGTDIQHVSGSVDPARDIEIVREELALKDLETIEKRIEKIQGEAQSGNKELQEDLEILKHFVEILNSGKHIIDTAIGTPGVPIAVKNEREGELLQELQLLTSKPAIYIFNAKKESEISPRITTTGVTPTPVVVMDVREELDGGDLSSEERKELSLGESKLNELIKVAYKILDLVTFFTSGEKETRAWTVAGGAKAPQAAGVIHTDFQKEFIRAEVVSWDKFVEIGGWARSREAGVLRTEGKDYIVQDGDVLVILHAK